MNTYQMKLFLEAVKCMNFTEAAERMYISQPSLSRQISSLEAELNVQLFLRGHNRISLTPAGKELYEGLSDILPMYEEVIHRTVLANQAVITALRIGILEDVLLPDILWDFSVFLQENFPNISVSLKAEGFRPLTDGLRDRQFDAIVSLANDLRDNQRVKYLVLERLPLFLVVRKEHLAAERKQLQLSEFPALFSSERFICISPESSKNASGDLQQTLLDAGIHPPIRFVRTPAEMTLQVLAGQGITIVNNHHVQANNPELRFIPIDGIAPSEIVLAWDKNNNSPECQFLIRHIKTLLKEKH